MIGQRTREALEPAVPDLPGGVLVSTAGCEQTIALPVTRLPAAIATLQGEHDARLADLFGLDQGDVLQLHVLMAVDREGRWLRLVSDLPAAEARFPSLSGVTPAATWYEREVWSEVGIEPEGHSGLTALRLPPDWPAGVYPHRAGRPWSAAVPSERRDEPVLAPAPEGIVDYPLGPVRSGVVESGHYLIRTVGEEIVDLALRLFYKHRGVEQRAVGLGPLHLPLVAERISGTDAFAESLALCQALETLTGVEVPPRAAALRTLFAELERLYNHLGYQADLCQATGLVVGQAQFDILKERVLRLNAALSGHRYLFGLNVPGGISRDLTPDGRDALRQLVGATRRALDRLGPMLLGSPSHVDRLEGAGILRAGDARAYATVGPVARASGQNRDLRRDAPYAAYREVEFAVPVLEGGDALARARVRLEESYQSLRILSQLIERLPEGELGTPLAALPPGRSGLGWAESARGETIHWVLTDSEGHVRRYRVRPASFANWQAFPLAVPGHNILTDFPVIEQSFGLSYAGNDR
jgi:Ni,Fe-hydrogenase III large subunit/Ni,Fe-hydrogenase III component G